MVTLQGSCCADHPYSHLGPAHPSKRYSCAQVEAESVAPALDLWWGIHRPSVAALVESLGISCRAEDAWDAADAMLGTHPGGLTALDAMIGNSPSASPPLRQNQVRQLFLLSCMSSASLASECMPLPSQALTQVLVMHVQTRSYALGCCSANKNTVPSPLRTNIMPSSWSARKLRPRGPLLVHCPDCDLTLTATSGRCDWAGGGWTRTWSAWAAGSTCSPAARRARTCARRTTWSCSGSATSASPSPCTPPRCDVGNTPSFRRREHPTACRRVCSSSSGGELRSTTGHRQLTLGVSWLCITTL